MADPIDSALTPAQKEKLLSLCGIQGPGQLLWAILEQAMLIVNNGPVGSIPNPLPVTIPSTQRTLAGADKTGDFTVSAGFRSVLICFSTDFVGTVLGATITPAQTPSKNYTAPLFDTLSSIAITSSAGSYTVETMV